MSYYLCFRKGGKDIINFCRCTKLYGCLNEFAPWDKWEEVSLDDLNAGKEVCYKEIERISIDLDKCERLLSGNLDYENRVSTIDAIVDYENDLKDFQEILVQIDMLISICKQKQHIEPEEEYGEWQEEDSPMEWGIF
jgi:hypothetical protein